MELISKWLSGKRNYHIGVVLYNQFGSDARLKKYFEGSADPIKQKKLEQELSALLQQPKVAVVTPQKTIEADEMPVSDDTVLNALRNEWQPLYQRMNYLRHELDKYEGNSPEVIAKRKPIAFEILSLEQQCMKIWVKRDFYQDHGRLREDVPAEDPLPDDPVELGNMIETLKRNIRRNKQLAEQHPDKPQYAMKVKEYQARLDQIKQSINNGKR